MNTLISLFDWALETSLRASALVLLVWLAQTLLGRHLTPRWRYALWLPVLLVPFLPSLPVLPARLPRLVEITTVEMPVVAPAAAPPIGQSPSIMAQHAEAKTMPTLTAMEGCAAVWALGVALLIGCGITAHARTLRRFRTGALQVDEGLLARIATLSERIKVRSPEVVVARAVESPAVAGLWHPVLLLPDSITRDFTESELTLVLKHELLHLKRRDLPMNALVCLLQALHWFNPLLWLAASRARQDRESACDSQVLALADQDHRRDYGQALLKMEMAGSSGFSCLGLVGISQRGKALRRRLEAVTRCPQTSRAWAVAAAVLIGALTLLGAADEKDPSVDPPERETPNGPGTGPELKSTGQAEADGKKDPEPDAKGGRPVASVNGRTITSSELKDAIEAQKRIIAFIHRDDPETAKAKLADIEQTTLEGLIDRELVLEEFERLGGKIKASAVDDDITKLVEKNFKGDHDAFITALAAQGQSLEKFRALREKMMIVAVMRARHSDKEGKTADFSKWATALREKATIHRMESRLE